MRLSFTANDIKSVAATDKAVGRIERIMMID